MEKPFFFITSSILEKVKAKLLDISIVFKFDTHFFSHAAQPRDSETYVLSTFFYNSAILNRIGLKDFM